MGFFIIFGLIMNILKLFCVFKNFFEGKILLNYNSIILVLF